MTHSSTSFTTYNPCSGHQKIKVADGMLAIAGQGTINLIPSLTLKYVLHVPNLNLSSIHQITRDLNSSVTFFPSYCVFQDRIIGRMLDMLGNGRGSTSLKLVVAAVIQYLFLIF